MELAQQYKNWELQIDNNAVLWLGLSTADKSVNTLNASVISEFEAILEVIKQDFSLTGLVIYSAKQKHFIVGADIEQFTQLSNEDEAYVLIRRVQCLFNDLATLKIPTVAMVKGLCLGGGLELALACDYRVAEHSIDTKLALPEVKLGIYPGWGGSVRLPQRIGVLAAMDMMLTGRMVIAKKAKRLGLVDAAVPLRQLKRTANYFIARKPTTKKLSLLPRILAQPAIRPVIAMMIKQKLASKAQESHYPAPYQLIDNWFRYGARGNKAFEAEAKTVAKLLVSDTSKNLVRVYYLQEQLKGLAKHAKFRPKHIHVIGAGVMGGDIAAWCAMCGYTVTLQDREAKYIAPAIARAHDLYKKKLKTPRAIQAVMDRLIPDPHAYGVANADVVIEAIFENKEAKQALYAELEPRLKPGAVLATNTSSIPLDELNKVLKKPQRLVGIHFFNPVAKMMLVEVVQSNSVDAKVIDKALAFVGHINKLPLPVSSTPGFLVNRVLMPYLLESVLILESGVMPEVIDKAALDFGMPMGPIELADTVGLDICLSVATILADHFKTPVPKRLQQMVDAGELGRKTGQGFYKYQKGKAIKGKIATNEDQWIIQDRIVYSLLNEAKRCLREGVVESSDLLDAGMVFGTGFAPFRGGPMHYAESVGIKKIIKRFDELEQDVSRRFKADEAW